MIHCLSICLQLYSKRPLDRHSVQHCLLQVPVSKEVKAEFDKLSRYCGSYSGYSYSNSYNYYRPPSYSSYNQPSYSSYNQPSYSSYNYYPSTTSSSNFNLASLAGNTFSTLYRYTIYCQRNQNSCLLSFIFMLIKINGRRICNLQICNLQICNLKICNLQFRNSDKFVINNC